MTIRLMCLCKQVPSTYNFSGNNFNGEAGTGDVLSFAGMSVAVTVDLAIGQTYLSSTPGSMNAVSNFEIYQLGLGDDLIIGSIAGGDFILFTSTYGTSTFSEGIMLGDLVVGTTSNGTDTLRNFNGSALFNVGGIPTLTTFFTDVVGNNNLGIATDTGDNVVLALDGDDTILGSAGFDYYFGGAGFDTADYSAISTGGAGLIVNQVGLNSEIDINKSGLDSKLNDIEFVIGTQDNDTYVYTVVAPVIAGVATQLIDYAPVSFEGVGGTDTITVSFSATGGAGSNGAIPGTNQDGNPGTPGQLGQAELTPIANPLVYFRRFDYDFDDFARWCRWIG